VSSNAEHNGVKKMAIEDFRHHVSSEKVRFWEQYGMDVVMGRREGPFFWDLDEKKRLFNLHCNGGVYNLGHRNPEIIQALRDALSQEDIGNGHMISRARADLGRKLAELMPEDLNYTVFGACGGEAVDVAFKIARAHTRKSRIISARGGYHGHTGLALAAGDEKYRAPFGPQSPGFVQVPFDDLPALSAAMDEETAAVVMETVPATLGMPIADRRYFQGVRDLCRRAGALMILDEVQTGLGRTGKLWAFEHFDVVPDVVVLAKGLSGGIYPITATVIREPIEAVFHPDPHIHVSTFGGAELGCRVALKVLEICSDPAFLGHVDELACRFARGVESLIAKHRILAGLRQLGLFMGLAMEDDACGPLLSLAAFQNDLLMVYANNDPSVAQFLPPLVTTAEQADWVIERLDRALAQAQAFKDSV
jgi:acetylornithine/succinyldiaminopimelate/putrescine aminotransferase